MANGADVESADKVDVFLVNAPDDCAVLRSKTLLYQGKEFTIHRRDRVVGRVRVAEPGRLPYIAVNILEGTPAPGDRALTAPVAGRL